MSQPLLRSIFFSCAILCTSGWGLAQSDKSPRLYGGLALDASTTGYGLAATISYELADGLSLLAQGGLSGFEFPQIMCVVTAIDTIALIRGSQFYFGDDYHEANLIVRDRAETSIGTRIAVGDRYKFISSLQLGLRMVATEAQVDEGITPEAARKQTVFGCGAFHNGLPEPRDPQRLAQPAVFTTNSSSGFLQFGAGVSTLLRSNWQLQVQVLSRHNLYGNTRFQIRDPREPGRGSTALLLREHAPLTQWRVQLSILAPLW